MPAGECLLPGMHTCTYAHMDRQPENIMPPPSDLLTERRLHKKLKLQLGKVNDHGNPAEYER